MSQEPLWKANAEQIVRDAYETYEPVARYVLFSGGNDSSVLTHWAWSKGLVDAAVFIDTGTSLPGVSEFAHNFCAKFGIPWRTLVTPRSEYERLVLEAGFPGPPSHRWHYAHLKERRVEDLVRRAKEGKHRSDCVALLTGCRRSESRRRMGTSKPVDKKGGQLWLNPILDWTSADMADYRLAHGLPQSDVAALCHRSGECNCLAYAYPGEREDLFQLVPMLPGGDEYIAWIQDLEQRVEAAGHARCRWGEVVETPAEAEDSPLCTDCQLRLTA
jgi:3'-phosphoadenosine 5'-phosphosulfate sulfotransferase (PAPS reductase)/FAD synthetase